MTDLINLLSKLVDNKGKILIPGVNELVTPLTEQERSFFLQKVESCVISNILNIGHVTRI
jgi:hypothetical protein